MKALLVGASVLIGATGTEFALTQATLILINNSMKDAVKSLGNTRPKRPPSAREALFGG
jgi:hypothetical protein